VLITNVEGEIEYVNPKFTQSTGYRFDEVEGKKISILKSGMNQGEVYSELWTTILAGKEWFGEFQNKRKDGSLYWI
jgi:PAS domain S-box-containing protein